MWRDILKLEFEPKAVIDAQTLKKYCGYYNRAAHGHGYDLDERFDCGTGKRNKNKQYKGKPVHEINIALAVHPGTRPPFVKPQKVIEIVQRRLKEIPTEQARAASVTLEAQSQQRRPGNTIEERLKPQWQKLEKAGEFDPNDDLDARRRIEAAIVRRYGSERFRASLIAAFGGRCSVTGCNVREALEAAHIKPYNGEKTNYVTNGLLLRGDIHTLFDLNLLGIEPDSLKIALAPTLGDSSYKKYRGRTIRVPKDQSLRPNRQALDQKWKEFQRTVNSHG